MSLSPVQTVAAAVAVACAVTAAAWWSPQTAAGGAIRCDRDVPASVCTEAGERLGRLGTDPRRVGWQARVTNAALIDGEPVAAYDWGRRIINVHPDALSVLVRAVTEVAAHHASNGDHDSDLVCDTAHTGLCDLAVELYAAWGVDPAAHGYRTIIADLKAHGGVAGLHSSGTATLWVHPDSDGDPRAFAATLAHEIGHLIDREFMDDADRERWMAWRRPWATVRTPDRPVTVDNVRDDVVWTSHTVVPDRVDDMTWRHDQELHGHRSWRHPDVTDVRPYAEDFAEVVAWWLTGRTPLPGSEPGFWAVTPSTARHLEAAFPHLFPPGARPWVAGDWSRSDLRLRPDQVPDIDYSGVQPVPARTVLPDDVVPARLPNLPREAIAAPDGPLPQYQQHDTGRGASARHGDADRQLPATTQHANGAGGTSSRDRYGNGAGGSQLPANTGRDRHRTAAGGMVPPAPDHKEVARDLDHR